ncbi:MAG: FAD binding domain-containing protein [Phycisphaerales bacterium]
MRVLMPANLDQACEMLIAEPGVVPVAGATDVLVHWPVNLDAHDRTYLDLSGLGELRSIAWSDSTLTLGAMTTYWDTIRDERIGAEYPLLHAAARQVGAIQIQSRGTWAGNIVNASPAADGVPVLMAYDATVVLASRTQRVRVKLDEFYLGYKKMRRQPDQLVVAIELPRREYTFSVFEKVGARRAQAITKVGVAVTHSAIGWRVVANSVAPTVCRCRSVEAMLDQDAAVSSPDGFQTAIRTDVTPIDDIRSTAEYREDVLSRLLYHSLRGKCPGVT